MTEYTELRRLAEAAESFKPTNLDLINPNYMAKAKAAHIAFADKAPPHVVLSMIDALDVQAGSIEAVQAANQRLAAERVKLRTQNQALVKALEELTDCGAEAWGEDRPCVQDGRAALTQAEGGV